MPDSLLEVYIERILEEREKRWGERDLRYQVERDADRGRVDHAFAAAEKASDRAVAVSNEFRGQLADQAATFLRKEEAFARFSALDQRLADIGSRLDKQEGRSGGFFQFVAIAIAASAVIVALFRH